MVMLSDDDMREAWAKVRIDAARKCWVRQVKPYRVPHWGFMSLPATERVLRADHVIWYEEMEGIYTDE